MRPQTRPRLNVPGVRDVQSGPGRSAGYGELSERERPTLSFCLEDLRSSGIDRTFSPDSPDRLFVGCVGCVCCVGFSRLVIFRLSSYD